MTHLLLHDSSTIKFLCPDVMGSFTGRRIGARTLNDSMKGVYLSCACEHVSNRVNCRPTNSSTDFPCFATLYSTQKPRTLDVISDGRDPLKWAALLP
jgi:hypothetical protein